MLPLVVMMLLMTLMMFLILFKIVGVPLNGSLTALLFGCMLFVLAYMAIGVLIVTLLSNLRLSLSIGGGYSVLAFTFSGLTFPMMAMYPWVQAFSKIFPFTFYTDIFIDQALRGAPVVDSLWDMGYIALFIVLPMLCLPPYAANVTAQYVTEAQPVKDLLVKQVSSSVKWQQCVETMLADGVDTFIEIGPGKTLAGFMKKIDRSVKTLNVEKLEDIEKVVEALKEA